MILTSILFLSLMGGQMKPVPEKPVSPIHMKDVAGVSRPIPGASVATVLLFTATDCPIANRMSPVFGRIVKDFSAKGIEFLYVYIDPTQTPKQVAKHLIDYKLGAPGILDSKHLIVKATGATVTPEAVVLDRVGMMLYRGRINDLFLEHGRARKAATREDLRIALKEILAGKQVSVSQTPALGCSIPDFGL